VSYRVPPHGGIVSGCLSGISFGSPVSAQDSVLVNYQGYLTDNAENSVTESPAVTFKIYDDGGVSKWSETHPAVVVTNGQFK